MAEFFLVLFLINQGFMYGYMRTLTTSWNWMEDESSKNSELGFLEIFLSAQMISWTFLFGDFSQIQLETPMQMGVFFMWTVLLPLLSMNILIVSPPMF
jgi:hypothetical protein